jgi:hypothetical protein
VKKLSGVFVRFSCAASDAIETRTEAFLTRLRMQLVSGDTLGKLAVEISSRVG